MTYKSKLDKIPCYYFHYHYLFKQITILCNFLFLSQKWNKFCSAVNGSKKKTKMAAISGSSKNDALYISLLGLAENFRVSNPPNIRLCIHCLQSVFNINPPPLIISRTHLQLGNLLLAHTKNKDLATRHLEQAVSLLSEWKYILFTIYWRWQKLVLVRKLHEFWLNIKENVFLA